MRASVITSLFAALASAASIPRELQPRQGGVITQCTQPGVVALTFDDGPYQYEPSLLQKLEAAGAKATFFVTGTLYNCIYSQQATLQAAYNAGHQIAGHTWTHANLANLQASGIQDEMKRLEDALANILGIKPNYMRPPNGATGGSVIPTVSGMGYKIVTWDVDSGDWSNIPASQSQQTISQAGTGGNGHIILMHETIQSTVNELVPWVLNWAQSNNLRMVTVAECLGDANGAHSPASPAGGSQFC
ncbi:hypothetical protein AJ80_08332 [Polytolypa hystricis UAMH7299]|uniref:NodB homology domain-containing protein n=1 Tax=Polytolypa hystricis (strain UAMH7299) TaxID=1447883 RepID=A0A2B7X9S0_POLH7|nr:hypothetical protein AJ80_08332 [Polytolypa hystricis UAMH7299]